MALCISLSNQIKSTMIQRLKNGIKRLALTITFMFLFVMPCNTLLAEEQTAVFEVKGMTCGSCPFILKRTLRVIDGVTLVKVFYDKRQAVVVFENTVVDIQQFSEAIEKIGFSSRLLKLTTF